MSKVVKYDVGTGLCEELIKDANTPDYEDSPGVPKAGYLINPDLSAVRVGGKLISIEFWLVVAGLITSTYDTAAGLENHKRDRREKVVRKSARLIGKGFTFGNKKFDCSDTGLAYLHAYVGIGYALYPISKTTMTEKNTVSFADDDEVIAFLTPALDRRKVIQDGEASLLAQIKAANNKTVLDAIVDNRT